MRERALPEIGIQWRTWDNSHNTQEAKPAYGHYHCKFSAGDDAA
jgi:hypothetical protein